MEPLTLNPTGYYQIDAGSIQYWTFEITQAVAYEFTISHNTWAQNQSHTMRFWVSDAIGGMSVHGWPQGVYRTFTATKQAQKFIMYDSLQQNWQFEGVILAWPVVRHRTYYLHAQNQENKLNGFGLQVEKLFNPVPE
jgi:hypothetical protein